MNYDDLINTISEIVNNEKIHKNGLFLTYELNDVIHKRMNEQLFYKSNPPTAQCVYTDEFEVELGGLLVKFTKKLLE
jgi:hypothetical protein